MASLLELIQGGSISEGEKLVWSRRIEGSTHHAHVGAVGEVVTSDGKKHKTPSGAARHLNGGKPVDGWIVWKVAATGKSLAELRPAK
jgi:hypothetical protein